MPRPVVRVATAATAALLSAVLGLGGCGSAEKEEAERQARMTLDDGAVPVAADASTLTGGFDRSTAELSKALPTETLRTDYSEIQTMGAESLRPSEASGCKSNAAKTPSLPATEVLATRAPSKGKHQPETADVVAARARTEPQAEELLVAVREAAGDCSSFSSELRDLGEGSFAPAEKGSTTVEDASHEDWQGLRTTTEISLTGKGWTQDVVRQSLVLRRGQIVVHVKVEGADAEGVATQTDALMKETTAAIDGED